MFLKFVNTTLLIERIVFYSIHRRRLFTCLPTTMKTLGHIRSITNKSQLATTQHPSMIGISTPLHYLTAVLSYRKLANFLIVSPDFMIRYLTYYFIHWIKQGMDVVLVLQNIINNKTTNGGGHCRGGDTCPLCSAHRLRSGTLAAETRLRCPRIVPPSDTRPATPRYTATRHVQDRGTRY